MRDGGLVEGDRGAEGRATEGAVDGHSRARAGRWGLVTPTRRSRVSAEPVPPRGTAARPAVRFPARLRPPPQIWGLSPVHILGTAKLSRLCPQAPWVRDDQTRSGGCGSVDERYPQAGDESVIHRLGTELSTDNPQAGAGCPQRSSASPHRCPLFGNATRHLTVSSERRHTKVPGWAVGKAGKAGDGAGEKWPSAVHGVCRTFRSPQKPEVVHRRRPQGRWTKFLL